MFQSVIGQTAHDTIDLRSALALAEKNYPAVAAKAAQVRAAEQDIKIQKNTLVPSFDAAYQADYATYNNITGMAYPAYLIPISGPPSAGNDHGVFGSAAGLLLNWEPISFGQRQARTNTAKQNYQLSLADQHNTVYQQQLKVIAVFLNAAMAGELIKVYEENIRRTAVQLKQIRSLVVSGIRPGVDTSLFQAELAKANIDLYNIRTYAQQQQIDLAQLTDLPQVQILADSTLAQHLPLLRLPDSSSVHPLLEYDRQLIRLQEANKSAVQKDNLPKLTVWGTAYARGSDVRYDGTVKSLDGLGFSRYNYGLGLQLSVPILKFTYTRLQLQKQDQLVKAYQSQLQETQLQLTHDSLTAALALANAIKIAGETPVQLKAAATAYRSLLSRYNSGLASFADLIQAQYALVKAETDLRQSYVEAWKALLLQAAARGDINLFLNQVN